VVFAAGAPGSYLYWASLGNSKHERDAEREQIAGAFIVDPPGGSPPDRVLVMNIWGTRVDSATYRNALTINGRSWPYTERIRATVGDTLRWRVPNASWRNHPMHLHGFYYRVEARGDGFADTLYSAAARRQVVTERGARPPAADSIETQGSVLVLTRGQPTDIVVVNRLSEPTAIHWHGIELESYSDGVAGWSGTGDRLAPSVMPGDSFTARLTLPRAETFMYHTHLNDIEQLISGLYGGIVVLEPGKRFDARRDHLFVTGWDGEIRAPALPHLIINGDSLPGPLLLAAGVVHRLRFVNIAPAGLIRYAIYRDTSLVTWRRLAKDGADLPPAQSIRTPSTMLIAVGETYDFEFTPDPGRYRLVAEIREKPLWTRELVVR
jgi:FtsP/CotA-like multicopper oxidase with cupredoxin domain